MVKDAQTPNFPNHFVNPREKGEDWIFQMTNAIYNEWGAQSIASFEKGADRYRLNKLYSLGKQPNDIYKPMFELAEDENSSFINLDYSPLPIIPKFRRITNNRFAKMDFTVTAQAIDDYALDEKSDYEAEERANIEVRSMLQELGIETQVLESGEVDQPRDEEELAIKMQFGYKHNQAIDLEKRIDAVFTNEKIHEKLEQVRDYGFNTGVFALKTFTDQTTGKVGIRVVDPGKLIISPTADPYFRDIWYAGETILMTIDEVRRAAKATGVEISEKQFEELASKNAGRNGNPKRFENTAVGAFAYDSCKVEIFDVEFLSCNRYWYEKVWRKNRPIVGKVEKPNENKKDREYFSDDRTVVFRNKLVLGTKIMFDYGLKNDIPVKRSFNTWETTLSYKIVAPEMNNMESSPIIENLIPIVDQICIAWYKLQNVIACARPKGIMIEMGALEDISLGDGGDGKETLRPLDVLDLFSQKGILVYRKINFEGQASNYKPIEELNNGLGTEAAEYFAVIDSHMQKIRDMIGFNDVTDGSTPDPKTLNGVASMSAEATENALHHLFAAEKALVQMVAEDVAIRVHDSIAFKENSPYRYVLAPEAVKSIRENANHIHREYSIAIEYGSDRFEKERLQARIQKAQDNQEITLADAIAVERCRNTKQAEQILAYRIQKNAERVAQQKKEESLTNAKANMDAGIEVEKKKQETLILAHKLEMEKLKFDRESEAKNLILKYTLEKQTIHDPNRQTDLDLKKAEGEAMKEVAVIKGKLANEGKKEQAKSSSSSKS